MDLVQRVEERDYVVQQGPSSFTLTKLKRAPLKFKCPDILGFSTFLKADKLLEIIPSCAILPPKLNSPFKRLTYAKIQTKKEKGL